MPINADHQPSEAASTNALSAVDTVSSVLRSVQAMGVGVSQEASPPARTRSLSRVAVALAVVLGGTWLVLRQTDDLASAAAQLSVPRLVASGLLAILGVILIERTWLALLRGFDVHPAERDAAALFFVSLLAKYLPGSVWHVVAQMKFAAKVGAPRQVMLAVNILFFAVVTASGIAVGGLLLPWFSPDGLARYWWLLVLLPPLAVGMHPRLMAGILDWLLRRFGRQPLSLRVSSRSLLAALAWSLAVWAVLGVHLALLAGAYTDIGPAEVVLATGAMGLAWAAGVAFIPAPGGAGVREAALVMCFLPLVGTDAAVMIALGSRALLLVADVLLALWGAFARRAENLSV